MFFIIKFDSLSWFLRLYDFYSLLTDYFLYEEIMSVSTAQKMKFSVTDFFSKCDQIRSFQQIWSQLLKKSVMENFIFLCSVGYIL